MNGIAVARAVVFTGGCGLIAWDVGLSWLGIGGVLLAAITFHGMLATSGKRT